MNMIAKLLHRVQQVWWTLSHHHEMQFDEEHQDFVCTGLLKDGTACKTRSSLDR